MTDPAKGSPEEKVLVAHAVDLLTHYSFDLGTETALRLLDRWLKDYPAGWIRWAVIEALYQGRYKAVSVDQILLLWKRRQHPCYHFSYEFERLVCHKFPRNLAGATPRKIAVPQAAKEMMPNEAAVLPTLPAPSKSVSLPIGSDPPAWVALAEQIQDDTPINNPPSIEPIPASNSEESELEPQEVPLDFIEEPEQLLDRVARLQAGVEALIEQATSSLNASTEAMKTKLQPESELEALEDLLEPEAGEEVHPPIHQFTPVADRSDFHSKLKAVAEQEIVSSAIEE